MRLHLSGKSSGVIRILNEIEASFDQVFRCLELAPHLAVSLQPEMS
jgi:hypothetical protein